jgi:uncharacterized protein YjfI (DUF2170 family)
LDFSLFTQIDTIEIADIHLNFNDILQNQNFGIKKLIISKDLCIRLENSNDFNDFMLTSLKVFPTLKIIKFDKNELISNFYIKASLNFRIYLSIFAHLFL